VSGSLKPKLLYQLAVSFLYSAAPIIVFPYISRVLGPQNIGKINFIDYTAQFILLFTSFGIPLYGVREVGKLRNKQEGLKQLASELLTIHFIISLAGLLLFLTLAYLNANIYTEKKLILLASLNIIFSSFALDWFVQGLEDFSFLSLRSAVIKVITITATFIFIRQSQDYIQYYFILTLGVLLLTVTDIYYVIKRGFKFGRKLKLIKHLKPLLIFFLTTATVSLYTYLDTILLGIISGSLAVGFYTTGLKVIKFSQNFVDTMGGVLLPRVAFLMESKNKTEISRLVNKSLQYVLTISIPMGFLFYLMAPEIVALLAGHQYAPSISVIKILSFLPLFIGLSNIFGIQILIPFGKESNALIAVAVGSLISIVLNIILCPKYAEDGAALACVVAEWVVTIMMGFLAIRQVQLFWNRKKLFYIVFNCLLFVPIIYSCRYFLSAPASIFITSLSLCILIFVLIQKALFKNEVITEIIEFVRGSLRRLFIKNSMPSK